MSNHTTRPTAAPAIHFPLHSDGLGTFLSIASKTITDWHHHDLPSFQRTVKRLICC